MIKVYSKEHYANWKEFKADLVKELNSTFIGHDAEYKGFILTIAKFTLDTVYFNSTAEEVIKVWFEDESYLIFFRAVNSHTLILNEEDMHAYKEFKAVVEDAKMVHDIELKEEAKRLAEAQHIAYQKYLEKEARKAEKIKEQEELKKYNAKIDKALRKLNTLRPEIISKEFKAPTTYYEILGWMTKHIVSVRASMPDYMESWFIKRFGDVERYVVNSKKRTVNGNPMQWGLSLKLTFDEEVKGPLETKATSQNKKTIDNVGFVWDLVENLGFQFGKKQDVEKIREGVPQEYMNDFEKGLTM